MEIPSRNAVMAGTPETSTTTAVIGTNGGQVTSSNTAGTVNGDVGNQYTNNYFLCFPESPKFKLEVANESNNVPTLRVEYARSVSLTGKDRKNEVATDREATAVVSDSRQTDCEIHQNDFDDMGIIFRNDHFAEPQDVGVKVRPEMDDEWEIVEKEDISLKKSPKNYTGGKYTASQKHSDLSGREWHESCSDRVEMADVSPNIDRANRCSLVEDTDGCLTEYVLERGSTSPAMTHNKTTNVRKRKDSTISKITHGLLEIVNEVDVNSTEHILQDIVFVLPRNPQNVREISQNLREIMRHARSHDSPCNQSKTKRPDVSDEYNMFALQLAHDLYGIDDLMIVHEAEQLIDDVMCLGRIGVDTLWEFEAFLKDLKF